MTDPAPAPFDPCGPLPGPGVTVLEASAGTGKTFTIAAAHQPVRRQGVPLEHILAVTFTRIATAELRDRVRRPAGLGRGRPGSLCRRPACVHPPRTGSPPAWPRGSGRK